MFEAIEMMLGTVVGGAGLFLLVDGLRGRRIGREPRCRKCGYSLIGRVEGHDRCPECGSWLDLPGAVRYGERQRHRRRAILGLAMLLLAGGWLAIRTAASFDAFDVMSYKPTWWVFNEMKSGTPGVTRELYNRLVAGKLSQAKVDQIIDWILAKQADRQGPWSDEWADFIEMAHRCNTIDTARWERYIRQGYAVQVRIRPVVRAGDRLPVEWRVGPLRLSNAVPSLRTFNLKVKAGEVLETDQVLASSIPGFGFGPEREGDPVVGLVTSSAAASNGRQKVVLEWEITAGGLGSPLTKVVQSQALECEVTDKPTAIGINRPDLRTAIVEGLSAEMVDLRHIILIAHDPPMDLAFDVVIEWPVRQSPDPAILRKGMRTRTVVTCTQDVPAGPDSAVRLILRPSATAAAQAIDLREYWDGDAIVIENFKRRPQPIGR